MKKYTIIAGMALALMMVGSVANAQMHGRGQGPGSCLTPGMQAECPMGMGGGPGHGMRGGKGHGDHSGMLLRWADEIGLSDEQISRIKTTQTEFRKQMIDDRAELEKAGVDLAALRRDKAESGTIIKAIDQVGRLKTELAKKKYLHHEEMKSILTAEQQGKLEELRKQHRDEMFQGRGQGHGKGHGMRSGGMGFAPQDSDNMDFGWLDESEF